MTKTTLPLSFTVAKRITLKRDRQPAIVAAVMRKKFIPLLLLPILIFSLSARAELDQEPSGHNALRN